MSKNIANLEEENSHKEFQIEDVRLFYMQLILQLNKVLAKAEKELTKGKKYKEDRQALQEEVERLKSENKKLHAKLKDYEKNLEITKADKEMLLYVNQRNIFLIILGAR